MGLIQFLALQALDTHGGRLPMTRLTEAVGISKSRLCHIVDGMATLGWVRREPDFDDGRGIQAVLTNLGAGVLVPAVPVYAETMATLAQTPLTGQQRAELRALVDQLAQRAAAPPADRSDAEPARRIA
ncbi:MarR family transcriptional regulator [Crossiella sp. SN42]|uniref:MarR family winged helix-turn-helix transcriptional regulator n=1 Tax=Crossiella sp. SN42 TaxID=2944808 RepID=UPI00207D67D9|nr:MarR family transcriptional regulator [Crossiella sp. SN42]MCO1575136.1 MarR family transcriptional regulator [Crossiella sp. SN42]